MHARRIVTLAVTAGAAAAAVVTAGCSTTAETPAPTTATAVERPCDWVTADEAAAILGGPVTATPRGDEADSVAMACAYSMGPGENGMSSELRIPGDAASEFARATAADSATPVDGVGVKAQCVSEPTTTPPSNTIVVLLNEDRIYRVTGWYAISCDQLKRFAQTAVGRIEA